MSFDALFGVVIGALISIIVTYLTHRWTWKRERQKTEIELEEEAISQVFSPLVFILEKVGEISASIVALHEAILRISKTEDKENATSMMVATLSFLTADRIERYANALESLLLHKSGLIKNHQFYIDLMILQSYLSTLVYFVAQLISKSDKDVSKIIACLSTLAPVFIALDEAIWQMRRYALKKTRRLPKQEYKQFFTHEKYSELENYLNEANKVLTGQGIPEWPLPLKRLFAQDIRKNSED